jgi:nucleotide-binding universal stress UspA family protein
MAKTIVVPLDGSEFAERALAPAAAFAKRTNSQVIVMTSQLGGVVVEPTRYLSEFAARSGISGAEVIVIPDRYVVTGLKQILADAVDPLVCMSTHGRSGVVQVLLGSHAEEAIRELRVPMLLVGPHVKPDLATRFDSVVVCTDGTATSRAIVPEVSSWIRSLRLRAWVVQVLDPESRLALEESGEEPAIEVGVVHSLAASLLSRDGAGINWDVLHSDHTADAIVDYARRLPASLIAMATHGRTGLARLALGSVAANVVHDAACPALVVRPDGLSDQDEPEEQAHEEAAGPRETVAPTG